MRKVEHRLRLDLLRGGNQGYIRVKRGENGARRLAIALYMHSVPYMADAGTTAVFRAIKPDNTKLFDSTTIIDNVVTVELTTQTVAALGTVRCELSIYGTNNELLYSPQFDIIVEDYLYSDTAVESTGEYTELTEAISKVNNIVSTEAARVAAENQRVANETARVSAEAERASAETARAAAETARVTAETERASAETTRASAESSRAFSENIRKQAEKQRVSSETQRDTAETARSNAESSRRSAETARVQEFNAIKADAQNAATAEATRTTNEAARVAAEANRVNAEQLRVALYNLWNNTTASAYGSLSPSVTLSNKDGHKHFNFGIPSNSRERYEIKAGELESTALNFTGFTFYNIWEPDLEWDANISSYGLPSGINKSFVLITGPAEITESGNIDRSWDVPQTIFDGQNIYMRRLGVSHTGSGSEDDPIVVSYYAKEWKPVGGAVDAVTYTPQTLTEEQKSQARTNIGAVSDGDVNDKLPIYIKMIPVANSNNVIAEDGTTGGQILGYLGSGREVVLVYQGFTYYLSEQGTEDGATTLTSLSFAACAKNPSDVNPNGVNVLSRITYAFNKDEFSVTTEGRYIDPIDGIVKSDLADDVQTSLAKADTAISLGLTSATPGQIIKVKAVQDGKPTEWEAVDMPSGEKWEKIKEITIAEDAEESNALTLNADENGNTFRLKKARLCARFPAYTGASTIPNFSFAMLNGKTTGRVAPLGYTSVWPKILINAITGVIYSVDVSGTQQIEHVQRRAASNWSDDTSHDYTTYGSASDSRLTMYGDTLWAKPITSIGGTGMLIYPGCHFVLYGVRE